MTYRLKRSDETVTAGVKRIARGEIARALGEIDDAGLGPRETVHQLRKRCKRLRGLVRLVRPGFEGYSRENAAFRDMAKPLSPLRDAEVLIESYDKLMAAFRDRVERQAFGQIRRRLTLRKHALDDSLDLDQALVEIAADLRSAGDRIDGWELDDRGFDTIAGGLGSVYRRARVAMAEAAGTDDQELLHEWRKYAKYHWYQARLLCALWPEAIKAHASEANFLGELLGDYHDLAVLGDTIAADPDDFGAPADLSFFAGLIEQRQARLAADALASGERLFAESPRCLEKRWCAYWDAWRAEAG